MYLLVTSIMYACESWTLTAELQRRIRAMGIKYFRKIPYISYKDHVTNEEVCAKIQQAIGPHEDLLTIVKRRKLSSINMSFVHQICQNYLARYSEKGKKTKQTEKEVERQHQGRDRPGVRQAFQWRTEKNGGNWL